MPVPFIATELDPEYIDVTLEEFDELCKWPMNKWTLFNKMIFAEKLERRTQVLFGQWKNPRTLNNGRP